MRTLLFGLFILFLGITVPFPGGAENIPNDARLLQALKNSADGDTRAEILSVLSRRRTTAVRIGLERIAEDSANAASLRMDALCALGGAATRDSVPALMRIVETDLTERRGFWGCAIPLLGDLADRRAVPLLIRIGNLEEEHLAGMNHMAIESLAKLADRRDVPFLESKAHIWAVRPAVFAALARIAEPATASTLITGLYDGEEPAVSAAAEKALRTIGAPARPMLEAALGATGDAVFERRIRAILKDMK